MSQLTKEQVDGIVQSIVKDAPANELLNTKIIGNLRIIDFSVQGLYERFDKTGVQECIRTKLIESIKKDQPKDEAAFKIRVAEVASSCVNERLGRRAAAPSSTEPNTGPTTRQTPPTETPEDQAAAAQTMMELDQLEEGLRKLEDANRITQEVKDQVEKMSAPPSTPAPK